MIDTLALLCVLAQPPADAPAPTPAPMEAEPGSEATTPPNHRAPPSEGVFAVGSGGIAPLPEPPPAVPASSIEQGTWRGDGWVKGRLHVAGAIGGERPARATAVAIGGGAEAGWRIRPWVGIGMGFSRQVHEVFSVYNPIIDTSEPTRGHLSAWDLAFVRFWAPVRGRVEPYLGLGGGVAFYDPARPSGIRGGWTAYTQVGVDFWIGRVVTLGLSGQYRATGVDQSLGHGWQSGLDFGLHW